MRQRDHGERHEPAVLRDIVDGIAQRVLAQAIGPNRSQAARVLGLSRQGLLKKIERYGLQQMGVED